MLHFTRLLTAGVLILATSTLYSQTITTGSFHKVIVSPFIEATFIESDQERVVVNSSVVDLNKLRTETKNGTLRIYLEGAKEIPHNPRNRSGGDQHYSNRSVAITIYYKKLDALSLRGEEHFRCLSPISAEHFTLTLYGESAIIFASVHINELRTTIYGRSFLEIESGSIDKQFYICYGEGRVNTTAISGEEAKLTAYGEADFIMNVSGRIRISSFGEATLRYKGNPQIVKGINVGGIDVARLDN